MDINSRRPEPIPPPMEPRGFFTGVEIRPIIIGVVVDYLATFGLFIVYLITYLPEEFLKQGELSEEAIHKALNEIMTSPEGLLSLAIIGAFGTALGGYVAGQLAKAQKIKHGALVGFVSLVLGVVLTGMGGGESSVPYWYELLTYIVPIPAGALGGFFAEKIGRLERHG